MKPSGHKQIAAELLATRRWAYFIPPDAFVPGKGFRVSVVIEGERGHFPTGTMSDPPWFWGMTYQEAEQKAAEVNAYDLRLDEKTIVDITKSAGLL
jgi:hypothetical protein